MAESEPENNRGNKREGWYSPGPSRHISQGVKNPGASRDPYSMDKSGLTIPSGNSNSNTPNTPSGKNYTPDLIIPSGNPDSGTPGTANNPARPTTNVPAGSGPGLIVPSGNPGLIIPSGNPSNPTAPRRDG